MSLRDIATADLNSIMSVDFSVAISVTNPAGTTEVLPGFSSDIAQVIDPDTGQAVSGRLASVAISLRALADVGFGIPQGIEDKTIKPWLVTFLDPDANSYTFKVMTSNPDRAFGVVTCELELYETI